MRLAMVAMTIGLLMTQSAMADQAADVARARDLGKVGKYAESLEALEALSKGADIPPAIRDAIALGRAESLESTGEPDRAIAALREVAEGPDLKEDNPDLWARIAEIQLDRGDWESAATSAQRALKANGDHLLGRWVEARLLEARGDREKAIEACKWFVDYQAANNERVSQDAPALLIIGQAAEKYIRARFREEELSEELNKVINNVYEVALKADPNCWRAHWLEGRLFLSGYQEGDARRDLTKALKINPAAAEVIVTLGVADLQGYKLAAGRKKAERALEINPRLVSAHVLLADLNISDERFDDALGNAKKAVAENPRDEDALARLAAAARLLVDPLGAQAVESVALSYNPRPATFYAALAERLADRRKYHSAERAFLASIVADPDRADTRIGLGMLYMQIGREAEARDLFEAAFASDPFNVRANNMRLILKHMATYKPIDSEHYTVLVDPTQDKLLGKYISRYLESIHGELVKSFGYEPPGLTQIEIMKDHSKFSGRTVALPFIPTVGACTGKVVALASTRTSQKPFNWARVMKHELVHVITLQQTEFNIPHWYTEALAVESEGFPRPQPWNKMLVERVPSRRKLLNLDTINLGFIRPDEPEDRQLAYCQAQLYAQYMLERFGPDALIKMLAAYKRGLTTDRAIDACFHVEKADFEAKYLDFLDRVVKTIQTRAGEEKPVKFSELERQLKEKPEDADLNARMAYEHYARRDLKLAKPFADKALKLQPKHPMASYVKARIFSSIGYDDEALALLEPALDPEKPDVRVMDLLAELQLKAGKLDEAERLYEMGRKDDPQNSKWVAGLARVHLRSKDPKLINELVALANNDADDLALRKELVKRFTEAKDAPNAEHWGEECLFVDVYDPECHTLMADALVLGGKPTEAVEELDDALSLKPKKPDPIRVKRAKALDLAGKRVEARSVLDEILARDPENPEAKAARAELD
ncbi:tetratricopeptide repeat protein [Tundrisphaera lichenicola]|uniref:tetratricopeptide repeat protein n=1 Tax=Tundrisphaera lichenicola TaxID=2029860 RepID=UPI003EB938C0